MGMEKHRLAPDNALIIIHLGTNRNLSRLPTNQELSVRGTRNLATIFLYVESCVFLC
jgi:hypothetical protein